VKKLNKVERDKKGRFIKGHFVPLEWARAGGLAMQKALTPEVLARRGLAISAAKMGHTILEKTRGSISQTLKEGYASGRIAKPRGSLGMKLNTGSKISQALKGRPKPPFTDEHCQHIREARAKQDIRPLLICSKPNRSEQFLIDFFQSHNLPFRYVGDGEFILGGLCPDFLNTNGRKQLIELFGQYWHDVSDVAIRTKHFAQYGFLLLVIWEDKLEDEARLLRKVKTFAGRKE